MPDEGRAEFAAGPSLRQGLQRTAERTIREGDFESRPSRLKWGGGAFEWISVEIDRRSDE